MKDKLLTAGGYFLCYALIWIPLLGISWLLQQFGEDPIFDKIHNIMLYAGYPILGVLLGAAALIALPIMGILWVITHTMPYSLYALAFSPAVILFVWFKNRYLTPKDAPEEKRRKDMESLRKHKAFNPFDSGTKL